MNNESSKQTSTKIKYHPKETRKNTSHASSADF